MRRRCVFLLLGVGAVLLAAGLFSLPTLVLAQSGGGYDLSWNTVDGGGATFSADSAYFLGGTAGQSDAATPRSAGGYELRPGFWQASCAAALVPVTIARSGNTVTLSWTHALANQAYQVHRSTTPYFVATETTQRAMVTAAPWSYTDSDAVIGDPNMNYYYLVRPTCGAAYINAGRRGEFDFTLTPGEG